MKTEISAADESVAVITKLAAANVATLDTEVRKRVETVRTEKGIATYEQAFAYCVAADEQTRQLYSRRAEAEAELRDAPTVAVAKVYAEKREPIVRERDAFIEAHALRKSLSLFQAEQALRDMRSPTLARLDKQLEDLDKQTNDAANAAYATAKKRASDEIAKRAPVPEKVLKRPAHDELHAYVTKRAAALGVPYEVALTRGIQPSGGDEEMRHMYEAARCETALGIYKVR